MSVVKMAKCNFTLNDFKTTNVSRAVQNGQSELANHLLYLITKKSNGLYDKNRSNLRMHITPDAPDIYEKLKKIGHTLNKEELKELCHLEIEKQKKYILKTIETIKNKRNTLDENGESYDKTDIFLYKENISVQKHEYDKIRKHFENDQDKIDDFMFKLNNDYLCIYFDAIKKEQSKGKKYPKTKPSDIIGYSNLHLTDTENPHVHAMIIPVCRSTKMYLNPRYYSLAKQQAHTKLEKMYPQFLDKNISLGYDAIEALKARQDFLNEYMNKGLSPRQAVKDFKKAELKINKILSLPNLDTTQLEQIFEKNGIIITKSNEEAINFRLVDSDVVMNERVFRNKITRSKLKTFGERASIDKRPVQSVSKMETVIQNDFDIINKSLTKSLSNNPISKHKEIKLEAFLEFTRRLKKGGLYLDINNKGHASYLKLGTLNFNAEKGTPLFKYKSSLMLNKELVGSNFVNLFDLTEEDLIYYKMQHLSEIPNQINYRDMIYLKDLELEYKSVEQAFFLMQKDQKWLESRGYKRFESNNISYFMNKKDEILLSIGERTEDGKRAITVSNVHPKEAAELLYISILEDAKSLKNGRYLEISPEFNNSNVSALKYLNAKLLLSTDVNALNVKVNYEGFENDSEMKEILKKEIDKKINYYNSNFKKSVSTIRNNKFNFTTNSCFSLIGKKGLEDFDEANKNQVNETIVKMVMQHNVKSIKFEGRNNYDYIIDNQEELLRLAKNHDPEQIEKVEQFIRQAEIDRQKEYYILDEDYKNDMDEELQNKNKNKIKRR